MIRREALLLGLALVAPTASTAAGQPAIPVDSDAALRAALRAAQPGARIELAPGVYRGGIAVAGLAGTRARPIVVTSANPQQPAVIRGGTSGLQLSDAVHVHVRDLVFEGATGNGVNIDDGGTYDTPAHDLVLARLVVRDVGPDGNRDGIKLSGVDRFRVVDCRIERWGKGGSGIDMVGCHDGVIEDCTLTHAAGLGGSGIQAKGGTRAVTIRRCRFEHAGHRAVNLGGSTGRRYFRPADADCEAQDLTVEGCTFLGSQAPIAFVGVDGAVVRRNTIYRPGRWVLRILQETTDEGFAPCRNGQFSDNLVILTAEVARRAVNVGPNTAPATFRFEHNAWYCEDGPDHCRPALPVEERRGVYSTAPRLRDPDAGDLRQRRDSRLRAFGADSLR